MVQASMTDLSKLPKKQPCCLFRKCLRIPNEHIELFFATQKAQTGPKSCCCSIGLLCLLEIDPISQRNTRWDFQNSADLRQQKSLEENLLLPYASSWFLGVERQVRKTSQLGCWEMTKSSEWFERLHHAHPFSCEDIYIYICIYIYIYILYISNFNCLLGLPFFL